VGETRNSRSKLDHNGIIACKDKGIILKDVNCRNVGLDFQLGISGESDSSTSINSSLIPLRIEARSIPQFGSNSSCGQNELMDDSGR